MASAHELIASITFNVNTLTATFSSIPSTYRDLVIVGSGTGVSSNGSAITFNNDTTSSYYANIMEANGTTLRSTYYSASRIYTAYWYNDQGTTESAIIWQILDYAQTNKNKSVLIRANNSSSTNPGMVLSVGRWDKTNAITRVDIIGGEQWTAGTTFSLYGIAG